MKRILLIVYCLLISYLLDAQEKEETQTLLEQQLENGSTEEVSDADNDDYLQALEYLKKHPLNLNEAEEDELRLLQLLSDPQIISFFLYKKLLGNLIDIYELQSIPGWDIISIRKLLPYITVKESQSVYETMKQRLHNGENMILFRYGRLIEKSIGYQQPTNGNNYYEGSPDRLQLRYKYQYKNLLQFGFTADKDAGESFFSNKQKAGFDFYSMHLFIRKFRNIKAIAIGDYTINMGQGLLQWQGLAFGKSAASINIKKQGPVLSPYSSAGEFNFHRGIGIDWQYRKWEIVVFGSSRKLSANGNDDSLISNSTYISSLLNSGYHRTASESEDKNRLHMLAYGGTLRYQWSNGRIGLNVLGYKFSEPIIKEALPYNLFAFMGDQLRNYSIDYNYTVKNIHVFGEAAIDNNKNFAVLNGLIASIDPKIDIAVLHRTISKAYQSFFSNAFTESTVPNNENGFYAGLSIRPIQSLRIDAYFDMFRFPWLKARINSPSGGNEYFVQLNYISSRKLEITMRYRRGLKPANGQVIINATEEVVETIKHNWRIQLNYSVNRRWELRSRVELLWYRKDSNLSAEQGFLGYADIIYRPGSIYAANLRLQYFETTGYDSRLYAFENDLLYSYVIPAFYNKGFRYYINGKVDLKQLLHLKTSFNITMWTKISQTIVPNANSFGSGLDLIYDNTRTDIKFQFFLGW